MATTTKLELTQLLAVRNVELVAARLRICELEGTVIALRAKPASHSNVRTVTRPAYQPTDEQLARRAAMAAAKALAMSSGVTQRVVA